MTQEEQLVLAGSIDLTEGKRLKNLMADRGVELELRVNAESCGTGKCGTKVEVWVAEADLPKFKQLVDEERARMFDGLEVDPARVNQVYDDQNGEATCPACGQIFPTSCKECPECGLGFAPME